MLVIDTSVVVKWVVPETEVHLEADTDRALALLEHALIAPDCILGEFANAMFKKIQRGEIERTQAEQSIDILPTLIQFEPIVPLIVPAFELACALNHPVHDCLYLALAIEMNAQLITADKAFVERCHVFDKSYPIIDLARFE